MLGLRVPTVVLSAPHVLLKTLQLSIYHRPFKVSMLSQRRRQMGYIHVRAFSACNLVVKIPNIIPALALV